MRRARSATWFRLEVSLLKAQWPRLITIWTVWYIAVVCAMNFSYYRYTTDGFSRLKDIGHELIPALREERRYLSELPQMMLVFITISMLFVRSLRKSIKHPFVVNVILRFSTVSALAHFVRATMFISTTLPGSAEHCLDPHEWRKNQPKSPFTLMPNPGFPYKNCGDLIFSGHMLMSIVNFATLQRYARPMYGLSKFNYCFLMLLASALVMSQALLIIASRSHYTIDVVVALYIVPLLSSRIDFQYPYDMDPPLIHEIHATESKDMC